ncbi:hypothetical protein G7Y89_g6547 [Cudoniella acicularis]|uniref:Uncharacterized protein n=1 Tax=Cudoniella acicularis TaxID=354080 RepID=A0A8H4W2C2_9HELO|nr:hypothetical protein G7Y89_g6547 [Cudoniella acicularis]
MTEDFIFSSPPQKEYGEWPAPIRANIRALQRDGKSQRESLKRPIFVDALYGISSTKNQAVEYAKRHSRGYT